MDEHTSGISELKEDTAALQKRQNVLVGSESGNPVSCDDAFAAPLCGLHIYGKSTQDGTPTPDAPVPIVSAGDGGSVVVRVTGRNLLHGINRILAPSEAIEGGVRIVNNDGGNSRLVFFDADLKKGITYTISFTQKIVQGDEINVNVYLPDINQYVANKFSPIHDTGKIGLYLNVVQLGTIEVTNIQLEIGTDSTAYSPYREQLLTLPTPNGLPGIPVTSGGNYTDQTGQQWVCDEVDLERGVRVKNTCIVDAADLEITTSTDLQSTKRLSFFLPALARNHKTNALCNRSVRKTSFDEDITHFYVNNTNIFLFIPISAENPVAGEYIFLYALAAPVETPLTAEELAAYKSLTTYAPNTVVQASDGAGVKLDYQRDVNLVIKNLEDAIASMTTT